MEGTIVEKLECRPYADRAYMNMKAKAMVIAAQPKRKVEQLDSVVTTFKPISDHKHNVSSPIEVRKFPYFMATKHFRLSTNGKRRPTARSREPTRPL